MPTSEVTCPLPHLELFIQTCPARVPRCRDAGEVAVKLASCHFCLLPQDGFHQGIVDEDVLLLDDKRQKKSVGMSIIKSLA